MPIHKLYEDTDFRIGLDVNALIRLDDLDIPIPDQPIFERASVYYKRADNSRVGDGFAYAAWIWDVISRASLSKLLEFLGDDDDVESRSLYIKTDKRDAMSPNPRTNFGTYSAVMYRPILSGSEGTFIARSPYGIQSVRVQFQNLVEQ
jgi:hypothetical protein